MQTRFDLFFDKLPMPILIKNSNGQCVFFNQAYTELFGSFSSKSLLSVPERALTESRDFETLRTGQASDFEKAIRDLRGDTRDFLVSRRVFQEPTNESFLVISFQDLSEKKRLLRDLEEARMRQIETARLASVGRMTAEIAHEINNPLMVIMGKTWMARQKLQSGEAVPVSEVMAYLDKIESHVSRVAKIVKSLRTFSRDGSHDNKTAVAIRESVLDALTLSQERFQRGDVTLTLTEESDTLFAFCQSIQITQVVLNLLSNAYDAVEGKVRREVNVSTCSKDGFIEIAITDSGSGIDPAHVGKIFDPFFTTKGPGQGTGLGLSISAGIAVSHGGSLSHESNDPCRFVLRIPEMPMTGLELDFVV